MDRTRAQGSLKAAQLCLEQQLSDSAANRAYFAAFQAAIYALEVQGIKRDEWTHKGVVHSDFAQFFVRRLKPDPIPEDTLKKIVDAGIHAPSGGNQQTWGFILVRDPALKRFIRDHYWQTLQRLRGGSTLPSDAPPSWLRMMTAVAHLAEHLHEAPVILLACAPQEFTPLAKAGSARASVATIHGSIYPAVQNILLACRALGVGATLTTLHGFFEEELKQQLGIPAHLEIAALIPLGFPQGNFGPTKCKPVDEVIHWDRWGSGKK